MTEKAEHGGHAVDAAVGSMNPTKVGAAGTVLGRLGCRQVVGVAVPSGVPDQPVGWSETQHRAVNRARAAREALGARFGVGMEGGVLLRRDGTAWLMGVAVILTPEGRVLTGYGPQLLLPPAASEALRDGEELGPVIDRLSGLSEAKAGVGAIGWLTGNLVAREPSWVVALACAAAPLIRPAFYGADVPVAAPAPLDGADDFDGDGTGQRGEPGGSTVTRVPY